MPIYIHFPTDNLNFGISVPEGSNKFGLAESIVHRWYGSRFNFDKIVNYHNVCGIKVPHTTYTPLGDFKLELKSERSVKPASGHDGVRYSYRVLVEYRAVEYTHTYLNSNLECVKKSDEVMYRDAYPYDISVTAYTVTDDDLINICLQGPHKFFIDQ